MWKIAVMGSGHHLEEIVHPLEVVEDILAVIILNAVDVSIIIGLNGELVAV